MVCSVLETRHICMKNALQYYLIEKTLGRGRDTSDISSAFYEAMGIGSVWEGDRRHA